MTPAARIQAAIEILDEISAGKSAEQSLTGWARHSRFAGSGDRAAVRDVVFDAIRRRNSCAALGGGGQGRALILGLLRSQEQTLELLFSGEKFAPGRLTDQERAHLAQTPKDIPDDLPDWLRPELVRSLGDRLPSVAAALQRRAPVHLRVNAHKVSRPHAQHALRMCGIETAPHPGSSMALEIRSGQRKLRQAPPYLDGWVELQDAASQAVVDGLPLSDGDRVLDYCAGGGGKALAIAARSDVLGLLVDAHDIAPDRMRDLLTRRARAGANIRLLKPETAQMGYDLVLCDAPCSGSGSWRRTPDGKWQLTPGRLARLQETQDTILDKAATLTCDTGVLAFATCSVLQAENEDRAEAFVARNPVWRTVSTRRWWPDEGTDGFFLALFRRQTLD